MDVREVNTQYWSGIPAEEIMSAGAVPGPEFLALIAAGARILDLGCGNGHLAEYLATQGYALTGIDVNAEAITKNAACNSSVRYLQTDANEVLPFPEDSFDAVCSCFFLGSIFPAVTRENLIGDLRRILRPAGLVWIRDALVSESFRARYDASLGDPQALRAVTPNGRTRITHHFTSEELDMAFRDYTLVSAEESITVSPNSGYEILTGTRVYRVR